MAASSSTDLIGPGVLLDDRWEIIKSIGKGSFSEIFVAQDIQQADGPNRFVAIKLNAPDFEGSVLKLESQVIRALSDVSNAPKYIGSGSFNNRDYLVMELLTGDDMSNLRNRIRGKTASGLVPIPIAAYLARQMLSAVQKLHQKGYIHRDVKPSNFVRKTPNSTQYCMIDFGLAKLHRGKDGKLKERRPKADFRGTTVYCSPYVHDGEDQCPRDDLCSIFHVFLDMVCGKLPWGEEARASKRDKAAVAQIKHHYYANIDEFIRKQAEITQNAELYKNVRNANFPPIAQQKCAKILEILRNLKYEDTPNYDEIEMLYYECVPPELATDVSSFAYHYEDIYPWKDGYEHACKLQDMLNNYTSTVPVSASTLTSRASSTSLFTAPSSSNAATPVANIAQDPNQLKYKNLLTKIQTISTAAQAIAQQQQQQQQQQQVSSPVPSVSSPTANDTRKDIYSIARRWKYAYGELITLPSSRLTLELLNPFFQVLLQNQFFYGMHLGDDNVHQHPTTKEIQFPEKWNEFEALQILIAEFCSLYERIQAQQVQGSSSNGSNVETAVLMEVAE